MTVIEFAEKRLNEEDRNGADITAIRYWVGYIDGAAAQKRHPGWISVNDFLPTTEDVKVECDDGSVAYDNVSEDVLVNSFEGITEAFMWKTKTGEAVWVSEIDGWHLTNVTHWMPLIRPTMEGDNGES